MKRISSGVLIVVMTLAGLLVGCRSVEGPVPEIGTDSWYKVVSHKTGVIDADGHGPDIGSQEWLQAVSRKAGVYDALGHGPDLGSDEWKACVHRKVFGIEP